MKEEKIKELKKRKKKALAGGGKDRIEKQHVKGKFTARERIEHLVDTGSFVEIDQFITHTSQDFGLEKQKFYGDGVVAGTALMNGRKVCLFAQDFTVLGGSLSETNAKKIVKIMELAEKTGVPIVGLNDSGGARIQEGVKSLGGYADIFYKNTECSGVIPQISIILGPCAGGAVYSPAITDYVIMVDKTSHMFITGPEVIKTVTREEVNKEDLGGAKTHASKSGVSHLTAENEREAFELCKQLLDYLPQNFEEKPTKNRSEDSPSRKTEKIKDIIPENENKPYDVKEVIKDIADLGKFFEIQPDYAENIAIGYIRLNGRSIGVIANQPKHLAGCLDIDASIKAARFIRFCNAFNIPLLTLVDVPGFLPGVRQEHGGIIKHGAKLLYAYAEATVTKITVVLRKAYGGAYDVMNSKHLKADINLALPTAEIAVMGPEGAVNIIFKKEIDKAIKDGKEKEVRDKILEDYKEKFSNPWIAAEIGFIDDVIEPEDTRKILIKHFDFLDKKKSVPAKKRNGNIPL